MEMKWLQNHRTLLLCESIIFILLGFFAITVPGITTLGTEIFIGWLFVFTGVIQGFRSFKSKRAPGFIGSLLLSLLYLVFGIFLLLYPLAGILSLAFILTFFFICEGVAKILLAIQMRPFRHWGWLALNGLLALVIAYIIWQGWPGTAFWVTGLLIGINMLFFGFSLLFLALSIPKVKTDHFEN